ncbi:SPASM domain-containing protein [Planctomycetota bacterium]
MQSSLANNSCLAPSRYNHYFVVLENYFIFNTLYGSLVRVPEYVFRNITRGSLPKNNTHKAELIKHKFITTNCTDVISARRWHYRHLYSGIANIFIVPTLDCNYSCSYCFQRNFAKRNTVTYDIKAIEDIINLGIPSNTRMVRFTLLGGELFLQPDDLTKLVGMLRHTCSIKNTITLITNGSFSANSLKELSGKVNIIAVTFHEEYMNEERFSQIMYLLQQHVSDTVEIELRFIVRNPKSTMLFSQYLRRWHNLPSNYSIVLSLIIPNTYNESELDSCFSENAMVKLIQSMLEITHNVRFNRNTSFCIAKQNRSFAIGPDGSLYKCVSLAGTDCCYKTLEELNLAHDRNAQYTATEVLQNCSKCVWLPECNGGCFFVSKSKTDRFLNVDCSFLTNVNYGNHLIAALQYLKANK